MVICDGNSLPVAIGVASASRHEVTLVETTLAQRLTKQAPRLLVADKAYDSDPHDQRIKELFGTEVIAPHKRNRVKAKTQDGRKLRRYVRRWKVERFNAWIQNFKRIVTRYERHLHNYLGMVQLASILILLRNDLKVI
jgi:transposase